LKVNHQLESRDAGNPPVRFGGRGDQKSWPSYVRLEPSFTARSWVSAGGGSLVGKASRSSRRVEINGFAMDMRAPSRKPYFSINNSIMLKMLQKGRFKLLENHSRFVFLVSSSSIRVSRI